MLGFKRGYLISELLDLDLMLVISFINIAHYFLLLVYLGLFKRFLLNSVKHRLDCVALVLSFRTDLLLNKCSVLCPAIRTFVAGVASYFSVTVWSLLVVPVTVALGVSYCLRLISSVLVWLDTQVKLLLLRVYLVAVN